jgi:hypothetical protein
MDTILTGRQREDFFVRLYFDTSNGFELAGIKRAFLDFSRTLRIIDENRQTLKQNAENFILTQLQTLLETKFNSQSEFDEQHKTWTENLRKTWSELTYGQAQKWINMTLKYWLLLGDTRINGIELNAKYFHIPIDSYVQKGMFEEKSPKPWSKISNYDDYLKYQLDHRNKQTGNFPLVDEFKFFNNYRPK